MVIVMAPDASSDNIASIVDLVASAGGEAYVTRGVSRTIIGLVGDVQRFATLDLRALPGVADVLRISTPYKLVSRENTAERSVVRVAGVPIGGDHMTVIAGPCAVETPEQTLEAALMAEIGRASCRERVTVQGDAGIVQTQYAQASDAGRVAGPSPNEATHPP